MKIAKESIRGLFYSHHGEYILNFDALQCSNLDIFVLPTQYDDTGRLYLTSSLFIALENDEFLEIEILGNLKNPEFPHYQDVRQVKITDRNRILDLKKRWDDYMASISHQYFK